MVRVRTELMTLGRGSRATGVVPGFRAIPLEILTVPGEPVFSLAPLRFSRAKAQAARC